MWMSVYQTAFANLIEQNCFHKLSTYQKDASPKKDEASACIGAEKSE